MLAFCLFSYFFVLLLGEKDYFRTGCTGPPTHVSQSRNTKNHTDADRSDTLQTSVKGISYSKPRSQEQIATRRSSWAVAVTTWIHLLREFCIPNCKLPNTKKTQMGFKYKACLHSSALDIPELAMSRITFLCSAMQKW